MVSTNGCHCYTSGAQPLCKALPFYFGPVVLPTEGQISAHVTVNCLF